MKLRQALVIGLGQFGMSLSQSLHARGVEVLGVDLNAERVQSMSSILTESACFDATNEDALARTAPEQRDLCVCAIGEEARESSILVTALLRQLGASHVIARANDPLLERILRLVGAHEVVNPERAFGERLATRLLYDRIREEIPLGEDLVITELDLPPSLVGRKLVDLELPRRHGITVLAIRREHEGQGRVLPPEPEAPLQDEDLLIVVSRPDAIGELLERL